MSVALARGRPMEENDTMQSVAQKTKTTSLIKMSHALAAE
jgi:hypothetical protein